MVSPPDLNGLPQSMPPYDIGQHIAVNLPIPSQKSLSPNSPIPVLHYNFCAIHCLFNSDHHNNNRLSSVPGFV